MTEMSTQIPFLYLALIIASLFYSWSDRALAGSHPTDQIKEMHDAHLNTIVSPRLLSEHIGSIIFK